MFEFGAHQAHSLLPCVLQGAMAGLTFGLIVTLWIGFGQPKPVPPFKPVSVEGCPATNASFNIESIQMTRNSSYKGDEFYFDGVSNISLSLPSEDKEGVIATISSHLNNTSHEESTPFLHNLYAVSYMWVAAIGFLVTMLVGVLVSVATGGNTVLQRELFSSWVHIEGTTISGTENLFTEKQPQSNLVTVPPSVHGSHEVALRLLKNLGSSSRSTRDRRGARQ
ncbi:Sodium-coupled monocarboxylate transporter 1 [Portunus trituberculatus]|uniref:Sodium-coupled monocarboxylate transporter 1 n=1 Tax=Portunus trituberculatus TaxID=210409 RepID=A0A5B7D7H6_PORTR|nr:Sodium-coupled monocarboxylate transporter 1 [Portunus trituberculatus]